MNKESFLSDPVTKDLQKFYRIFNKFFLTQFKGLRTEGVTAVLTVKHRIAQLSCKRL